jgi:uncharacterized protein (TIGR04141 family)
VAKGTWKTKGRKFPYLLLFYKKEPRQAAWFRVFKPLRIKLNPKDVPATMVSGFIFIIRIGPSIYAVTGGVGHISLRKHLPIEFRFGIELAQKILTLAELRGLSQKDTGGIVNMLARGFRGVYNPKGDINNLKRVLTQVRGTLNKHNPLHEKIGSSIQASDSLTVCGRKTFQDVIQFLCDVDSISAKAQLGLTIPQLEHISKKPHGPLLAQLESQLVETLSKYNPYEDHSLFLDNEDIGYLPDRAAHYTLLFSHRGYDADSYEGVFETVRDLLSNAAPGSDRREAFRRMNLKVIYDDGSEETRSLFYFLCGDLEYENDVFFLNNQKWYRASDEFITAVTRELDNIEYTDPRAIGLEEWDKSSCPGEDDYNAKHKSFIVLHRRLVKLPEERGGIEFCDMLKISGNEVYLVHVKRAAGAALRALFAQGFVSAKLYNESDDFRHKVHNGNFVYRNGALTSKDKKSLQSLVERQRREMRIVFAISDDTKSHTVVHGAAATSKVLKGTLSTFAKVDLLDRVSTMRAMGYGVSVSRIRHIRQVAQKSREESNSVP